MFCDKMKHELFTMQHQLKLLVLDEVHKMLDRTTKFRECYDSLKSLKEEFPSTFIMALTATLRKQQLCVLCTEHLHKPVLLKSSVNKKNIKMNVTSTTLILRKERRPCGILLQTNWFLQFKNILLLSTWTSKRT